VLADRGRLMKKALYFETYGGRDYFRDEFGNIYTELSDGTVYCSNLKSGRLTEDKAEPYYSVDDIILLR
jgi:hypothetical protein